jgi:hypothetical protein
MEKGIHPARKRVHLALPIRLVAHENGSRVLLGTACTYDIYAGGARINCLRGFHVGETVTVERGHNKALCRVTWAGDPGSDLHGQFELECIEDGKTLWDEELRETDETYLCIARPPKPRRTSGTEAQNRRRRPRFPIAGMVEMVQIPGCAPLEADLHEISELGCLVGASRVLLPGTDLKLVLNIDRCDVALKGQVRHAVRGTGMGIEFYEIRKGDRPRLRYLLRNLADESLPGCFAGLQLSNRGA